MIAYIKEEKMFAEVIGSFEEDTLIVILDLIKDYDREFKTDHRKDFLSEDDHAAFRKCYTKIKMQMLGIYILEVFYENNIKLIQKND